MATKYAAGLAESFRLSKYTVGFIVVAVISILPEAFISIKAAIDDVPAFGLGMLFGSNVADLTLIFAILVYYAKRGLKVESKILKNRIVYPFVLLLPLILGFNGHFSRVEGLVLIIAGAVFYYTALKDGTDSAAPVEVDTGNRLKNVVLLIVSMILLLVGAHYVVESATALAIMWAVSPILIGMLIVGLGTTMPELFFSLKSVKKKDDSLAIGDLLGTVLADATIVVGILALVNPFFFPRKIIFITGSFMIIASFMLFRFMRSGRTLTKREASFLGIFWVIFVIVEFFMNL